MRKIFIITFILFSYVFLHAEEPTAINLNKPGFVETASSFPSEKYAMKKIYQSHGFFLDLSPGLSFLKNNNLSSDTWSFNGDFGYKMGFGYFLSINQWARIKLGIGFTNYSTKISGDGEFNSPEFKDIDNDNYFETLTLTSANYTINPMYITIPLTFEFGNANISRLGYYFDVGFEYSYLVHENNDISGSYSTVGVYPDWGVTLENIPELGFYSNQNLESNIGMKKSNISIKGGVGITVPLSGIVIFKLGLTGYLGLNDIRNSKVNKDDSSPISQQVYEFRSRYINNPMATSKGSKSFYTGIEFGFYFSKHVK